MTEHSKAYVQRPALMIQKLLNPNKPIFAITRPYSKPRLPEVIPPIPIEIYPYSVEGAGITILP